MPQTGFVHIIDGFAFDNSWHMQPSDWDQLRGVFQGAAAGLTLNPLVSGILGPLLLLPGGPIIIGAAVAGILSHFDPGLIGLCGGMTFAAADYFQLGWLPPRGEFAGGDPVRHPDWSTPEGSVLRRYIWARLLDTLTAGGVAAQTLVWMVVARNPALGGDSWLRDRSREQFALIKQSIDAGRVCPIALIGTTDNPMNNHQVLVTGYEAIGFLAPNSGRLYVYEPNGPNEQSVIDFDFTGAVAPFETHFQADRGTLKGFFTVQYAPVTPAPALVVSAGLTAWPASVHAGDTVRLNMTVRNDGFGDTPPLKLYIAGRAGSTNVDAGGEELFTRIAMRDARSFSPSPVVNAPEGARHYFASSSVEPMFFLPEVRPAQAWRPPADSPSGRVGVDLIVTGAAPVHSGSPIRPGRYGLQTSSGFVLTAEASGGAAAPNAVHTDRREIHEWETFYIAGTDGGGVTFQAGDGHFLTAEHGGTGGLSANRPGAGPWETFTPVPVGSGQFAFETVAGTFITAENNGGMNGSNAVSTNRTHIGQWETFSLVPA